MDTRVLLQVRSDVLRYAGGEATQVRETARALEALGVRTEVSNSLSPDLTGISLVHIFGMTQPTEALLQARHARVRGVPVVLSPVYQDLSEYDERGRFGAAAAFYRVVGSETSRERIKQTVRWMKASTGWDPLRVALSLSYRQQQQELVSLSTVLLPNSASEAKAILRNIRIERPSVVVPYAAGNLFERASTTAAGPGNLRDYVVCVGVITSLKNQLRLIAALAGTRHRLVLVGGRVGTHRGYYREVHRQLARNNFVTLVDPVPQKELAPILAAARVVALPSWFETCGMACLEGALAGCRVAITDKGYTRDYFGDDAKYCKPADIDSIRSAVLQAFDSEPSVALAERIREVYTWKMAATRTLEGYELARELANAKASPQ